MNSIEHSIRFHARCSARRGRSYAAALRQVQAAYGHGDAVQAIFNDEWHEWHVGIACDHHAHGGSRH